MISESVSAKLAAEINAITASETQEKDSRLRAVVTQTVNTLYSETSDNYEANKYTAKDYILDGNVGASLKDPDFLLKVLDRLPKDIRNKDNTIGDILMAYYWQEGVSKKKATEQVEITKAKLKKALATRT